VEFKADPFNIEGKFLLKLFDKAPADVAERSDEVGKNPDVHVSGGP